MIHPLSGVFAAALTPLKIDFTPEVELIPQYLSHFENGGCHGALLLGTTGEGPSFSNTERIMIMESALEYKHSHPYFKLLVGTGTTNIDETIELTQIAFSKDYDGVVVLPPYYFRMVSDDSLFEWFRAIIENAVPSNKYLLAYNIPIMTGISFSLDLLERLKEKFPLRFAGIKDSSSDEQFSRELGDKFGDELLVLTGNDRLLSTALNNNAGGCITALANLYSHLSREIWDGFQQPMNVEKTQQKLSLLRDLLERYSPYPPILKVLMNRIVGFPLSSVKPPLRNLDEAVIDQAVEQFNLLMSSSE